MSQFTQEWFDAYQRRRQPSPQITRAEDAVEVEADLHEQIADAVKARGWRAFHGSMAHRTFRTLGEPDFIIMAAGGITLYVECKARGGKLSVEQQGVILQAEQLGHTVHVVQSLREFVEIAEAALEKKQP